MEMAVATKEGGCYLGSGFRISKESMYLNDALQHQGTLKYCKQACYLSIIIFTYIIHVCIYLYDFLNNFIFCIFILKIC